MNFRSLREIGSMIATGIVACVIVAGTNLPACAFTNSDAVSAANAYLTKFVITNNDRAFIQGNQDGGDPGFWQEIEEIEGIEDANDRANGAFQSQVEALLNGFIHAHGINWSYNYYNDDIAWATIAYARGYQATGNTTFLMIAKDNYDMMFARAWDPAQGALYWTTKNGSYNSCIECPAGIAAYLLSQTLNDTSYFKKAQVLFAWEKTNLFDSSSGAIYDAVSKSGSISGWSSSYNQGTFVGLANYLDDISSAELGANYAMMHLGRNVPGGYRILPEYGAGSGNNAGLNSIAMRWISKFMKARGLQKAYLGWLQANANAAWSARRTSDNLSWCQWLHQTPDGVLNSWDCINSVVALQVTPPDDSAVTLTSSLPVAEQSLVSTHKGPG